MTDTQPISDADALADARGEPRPDNPTVPATPQRQSSPGQSGGGGNFVWTDTATPDQTPPDPTPPPPPPGTEPTTFLQSSGFKASVAAWVAVGLVYAKGVILSQPVSAEAIAVGVEMAVWTTLAAFGIHREGASLRYK